MKSSPNERLSEHLLNIDEEILANVYKIDTAEKLRQYIKTKNVNRKKSLYLNSVFRKTATVAACLFLIIGVTFSIPSLLSPSSTDTNNNSDTDIDDDSLVVVGDSPDTYGIGPESILSRNEKYLSPALQEKMNAYRDTKAVYRVIVEILITAEDYDEFTVNDEKLLSLQKQENAAFEAYNKALASLSGVSDESKRAEIAEEINEKEKIAKDLQRKCDERLRKLETEHYESVANNRLEYAGKLSDTAPFLVSDDTIIYAAYNQHAYFMELTTEEIYELAEKGGYLFRLASASKEDTLYLEKE